MYPTKKGNGGEERERERETEWRKEDIMKQTNIISNLLQPKNIRFTEKIFKSFTLSIYFCYVLLSDHSCVIIDISSMLVSFYLPISKEYKEKKNYSQTFFNYNLEVQKISILRPLTTEVIKKLRKKNLRSVDCVGIVR